MKVSFNWLKEHVKTDLDINKIGELLTASGLEVEGIKKTGGANNNLDGVIVGKVTSLKQNPNADKLKIATVNLGAEEVQIVCGAPNVAENQKVPVATIGSILPTEDGGSFKIKKTKLRGENSFGMICSEAELGLSDNHDGIMVLEEKAEIGMPILKALNAEKLEEDYQIEIGLTPNRADAMSHLGVARDVYASSKARKINVEFIPSNVDEFEEICNNEKENPIEIEVKEGSLAPRYAGLCFENVKVKPSPKWLQDKLKTIDINPINNVVDITNYILHDLGQPLHAFDADKISGGKIIVKTLPKGTKFVTLDGVERSLNGSELMICDEKEGLCMAGVYGGLHSGVTESTSKIFLESAYFDPVSIRKSSKLHGLNTDASFRFERGIDPNITIHALKKAAILLQKYADAEIVGKIQDEYLIEIKDFSVVLRYRKLDQVLGERIHRQKVKEILDSLGVKINSEINESLECIVPAYRVDVQREIDLIEEILRIHGYNNIKNPEKINFTIVKDAHLNPERIETLVAGELTSMGFFEAMNNSLVKTIYKNLFSYKEEESVQILNPLSADLSVMRQSMMPGLMENVAHNLNRKIQNIRLFEFGKIYKKANYGLDRIELEKLSIILSGNKTAESWMQEETKANFYDLKGIVMHTLSRLGLTDFSEKPTENPSLSEGISLFKEEKEVAYLGIVSKSILKEMKIDQEVFYAELDWEKIVELSMEQKVNYREISKFPPVKRDLALLLEKGVSYENLYMASKSLGINTLKEINLFDVYEGDKLPPNKKSYALSFILQDKEKTLSDKEIDATMNKLIEKFKLEFNAELRT